MYYIQTRIDTCSLSRISLQGGEGIPESLSISSSSVNVCSDVGEEAIRGDTENALDQNWRPERRSCYRVWLVLTNTHRR